MDDSRWSEQSTVVSVHLQDVPCTQLLSAYTRPRKQVKQNANQTTLVDAILPSPVHPGTISTVAAALPWNPNKINSSLNQRVGKIGDPSTPLLVARNTKTLHQCSRLKIDHPRETNKSTPVIGRASVRWQGSRAAGYERTNLNAQSDWRLKTYLRKRSHT